MLQLLLPEQVASDDAEPDQDVEASRIEIAPPPPPPTVQELLESIRMGWRDKAGETAQLVRRLSQATVEQALEIGRRLLGIQKELKRKEYSAFLSVLGWASAKARKFINLATTFSDFDPSQLVGIELTTLLSLCTKRYAAVVEELREVEHITQQMVEDLIKDSRTPSQPKLEPISGWKRMPSGGGRYYNVLLHSEEVGLSIEHQASSESILPQRVIAEAVALRAQRQEGAVQVSDYRLAQLEELQDVVDNARTLERDIRQLQLELSKRDLLIASRDRLIADLEAKITAAVVPLEVQSGGEPRDTLTVAASEPDELEELQQAIASNTALSAIAPDNTTQSAPTIPALDSKEPQPPSDEKELESPCQSLEIALKCDHLVEQQSALVLSPGDLVEINVTRPNGDKTWNELRGYIQKLSAATGKAAVLLQGDYRSKQFFLDELKLVEPVSEKLESADKVEVEEPSQVVEQALDVAETCDAESESDAIALASATVSRFAAPDLSPSQKANQKPKSNRKLQPVEILTTAGEWVSGFFVHNCIAVTNLVTAERQFTLFDAAGEMYQFFGQIRPVGKKRVLLGEPFM
jgi:hypothetical protein